MSADEGGGSATRLDQRLVDLGLCRSRSRARDLILRGHVLVGGTVAAKPSQKVHTNTPLALGDDAPRHVSRAAEKLVAALDAFGFDVSGRTVVDLGASTGGFTEVLLERGAARVFAVDVGRSQLDEALRDDPRVTLLEATDARCLTRRVIAAPVTAVTCDVSFISMTKAAGPTLGLAEAGAWFAGLIKPQFEVGPDHVARGGIVRDEAARAAAICDVERWLWALAGWRVCGTVASPVAGGDGNREVLVGAVKDR